MDENGGIPIVGDGTENDPFFLGVTSKALLENFNVSKQFGPSILHGDVTFKLTFVDFPLLVCGVSDRCRSFFPVAFFLASSKGTNVWVKAF